MTQCSSAHMFPTLIRSSFRSVSIRSSRSTRIDIPQCPSFCHYSTAHRWGPTSKMDEFIPIHSARRSFRYWPCEILNGMQLSEEERVWRDAYPGREQLLEETKTHSTPWRMTTHFAASRKSNSMNKTVRKQLAVLTSEDRQLI